MFQHDLMGAYFFRIIDTAKSATSFACETKNSAVRLCVRRTYLGDSNRKPILTEWIPEMCSQATRIEVILVDVEYSYIPSVLGVISADADLQIRVQQGRRQIIWLLKIICC